MQVQEVMHKQVDLVDPNIMLTEAAKLMRDDHVGALPVGENDRLVGMVTDRDIIVRAIAEEQGLGTTAVRQVMSEGVFYCFEDASLEEAGRLMAEHQIHRLPVLNHDKRMVGILALADLARAGDEGAEAAKKAITGISEPTESARR
jgi:CBS domain-containing protein